MVPSPVIVPHTVLPCQPTHPISQVTPCGGSLVPSTVAVKSSVPPLSTKAVAGLIVTLVTVGVDGVSTGLLQAINAIEKIVAKMPLIQHFLLVIVFSLFPACVAMPPLAIAAFRF